VQDFTFTLPPVISKMVKARNAVRTHYAAILQGQRSAAHLSFTLDGNLVGDIGEALAVELFGVQLVKAKSTEGIDGYAPNGKTVQVKATGTGRGPAFRCVETKADYLLFFDLDLEVGVGRVIFNGPEHYATRCLPDVFPGQRALSPKQIRDADQLVQAGERLVRIDPTLLQTA
jgi:hypothetical protein